MPWTKVVASLRAHTRKMKAHARWRDLSAATNEVPSIDTGPQVDDGSKRI